MLHGSPVRLDRRRVHSLWLPCRGLLPPIFVLVASRSIFSADCNRNEKPDREDLASGASRDCDDNGIPDECDVAPSEFVFAEAFTIETPVYPRVLRVRDLDGDGDADLVFLNDKVYVLRNRPEGWNDEEIPLPLGRYPLSFTTGDLDGDDRLEMIVTDSANALFILRDAGSSRFDTRQELPLDPGHALHADVEDLDGDGDLDLVVLAVDGSSLFGRVSAFVNDGTGGFDPRPSTTTSRYAPKAMALADFNKDLKPDVAVLHSIETEPQSEVLVFQSNGDGTFHPGTSFYAVAHLDWIEAADLDEDGDADIAASNEVSLLLFFNRGDAAFIQARADLRAGQYSRISLSDMDGDGRMDFLAVQEILARRCLSDHVSIRFLRNSGRASFDEIEVLRTSDARALLAASDLDGNGGVDLLLYHHHPSQIAAFSRLPGLHVRDCNANGIPDVCDARTEDCNSNCLPDSCEVQSGAVSDCDGNGIPDACDEDCNRNASPDACEIAAGASLDCNRNDVPDECEMDAADLDRNGALDACEIVQGVSPDCNRNGVPDRVDLEPAVDFSGALVPWSENTGRLSPADMDGDGDLDLVGTSGRYPHLLGWFATVFLNGGQGRFSPGSRVHTVSNVVIVVAAEDLDEDGDPDVLVAGVEQDYQGGEKGWIEMAINRGNGVLDRSQKVARTEARADSIHFGEFDARPGLDIAARDGGRIALFLNDGRGAFFGGRTLSPGSGSFMASEATDLDRDGLSDFVVGHANAVEALLNRGNASFEERLIRSGDTDPHVHYYLRAGDLDGDGHTDLVYRTNSPYEWGPVLLFNDGSGAFPRLDILLIDDAWEPVLLADLDRDADLDVTALSYGSRGDQRVSILRNDGAGNLAPPALLPLPGRSLLTAAADIDGDGDEDLLLHGMESVNASFHRTLLIRNTGRGTFTTCESLPVEGEVRSLATADLDGDGDVDFAVAHPFSLRLRWNQGGAFAPGERSVIGSNPILVLASDLNADGHPDLATLNSVMDGMSPGNVSVLLNPGGGAFGATRNFMVRKDSSAMKSGDLDGDGVPDLLVAAARTLGLSILHNDGHGGFGPEAAIEANLIVGGVELADMDGDADLDIAAAGWSQGGGTVRLLFNVGQGRFHSRQALGMRVSSNYPAAADTDGDGDLDLCVLNFDEVQVLQNMGLGFFSKGAAYSAPPQGTGLLAADFDGDFRPDLLAVGSFPVIAFLRNLGDSVFGTPTELVAGDQVRSLAAVDINGDGDLDIVALANRSARFDIPNDEIIIIENVTASRSADDDGDGFPDECGSGREFVRGDADGNSLVNISDAIATLARLFLGGNAPPCDKAADANDDGRLDLTDPIAVLLHLFGGAGPLSPPSGACGRDPTPDALGCLAYTCGPWR